MPWIDQNKCTSCGICVSSCPVDAISMKGEGAEIDMSECIRCGICHNICPQEAVRHDSEKIPERIKNNIEITKKNMDLCAKYLRNESSKNKCLERTKKHFKKEKVIAEKTLEELEKLK